MKQQWKDLRWFQPTAGTALRANKIAFHFPAPTARLPLTCIPIKVLNRPENNSQAVCARSGHQLGPVWPLQGTAAAGKYISGFMTGNISPQHVSMRTGVYRLSYIIQPCTFVRVHGRALPATVLRRLCGYIHLCAVGFVAGFDFVVQRTCNNLFFCVMFESRRWNCWGDTIPKPALSILENDSRN